MRLPLIRCHGSGNDFPLVDGRGINLDAAAWSRIAVALADRGGPVGGDGMLVLGEGDHLHAFAQRMWNSDGSVSPTCLNGLRCTARLGFAVTGRARALALTGGGSVTVERDAEIAPGVYTVREAAGPVSLDVTTWPLHGMGHELVQQPIAILPSARRFTAVGIGNPHLIAFVEAIDEEELVAVGRACEAAPEWLPNRANVSFVQMLDPAVLFVRTFERGVGLTDSCGSAMAASSFAACLTERSAFGTPLTVRNKGGRVRGLAHSDGMVELSGNATWLWRGWVEVDPATGAIKAVEIEERYPEEEAAWQAVRAAD